MARHPDYTPELGRRICVWITEGLTLREISERPGMPNRTTVPRWRQRYPDFGEAYRQALARRRYVLRGRWPGPDGRPQPELVYSDELADWICRQLLEGWSMTDISRRPGMPSLGTLWLWLRKSKEFQHRYGIACFLRTQFIADEALGLADAGLGFASERARVACMTLKRWPHW